LRRGSIAQLIVIGVLVGAAAAAVAVFVPWLPEPASRQAGRIHFVFWYVTAICIAIFALVAAVMIYSIIHFRARPDDDSDGPPIHGHTGLEIVWTAVPTALVTSMAILSAVVLSKNDHLPSKAYVAGTPVSSKSYMTVDVIAQQFAWSFKYPEEQNITSGMLRVPVGEPLQLRIQALDVIHSFWVPEWSQKQDGVPGQINTLVITPDRLGTFPIICTELCGLGHATMRSSAIVMKPAEFDAWVKQTQKGLSGPPGAAGLTVFNNNGCGSCHTLKAANATGKVGPDLDKLPAEAQQAGKPLEDFVRESIVDPDAYVAPGFPKGLMPKTFAQLPKDQLDSLVTFIVDSTKKGG
jgi:cytochrome c oxidase subunit 2